MNTAFDPVTNNTYDVDTWLKKCENRRDGICSICGDRVYLRADKSEERRTHFAHIKGSTCPSIIENHQPFKHLSVSDFDNENAIMIKSLILENAYLVYEKCKRMADGLTVKEFRELIDFATSKAVWNYKGLSFKYVPYILLTCRERYTKKDFEYRKREFYFVLDPNVSHVDELWNDTVNKKQKLWKIYLGEKDIEEYQIGDQLEPDWFKYTREHLSKKLSSAHS